MSKKILILSFAVLLFVLFGVSAIGSAKDFKIGINNFGQANFFARIGREALIDEVKKLGGTSIATVTASVLERINAIENYISIGVDAIIIQEGDIKMVGPALEEAKKQGIIIVSMDAGTADFVDIVVESNNWVMGAIAATELMHRIDGKGKVVEIYNDLGQMIRMRRKELHAVITEYPEVEIATGFTYAWPDFFPDAISKMEAVLQSHPDIVGVFATFDGVGVAAAQVIREAGLQDQIVVVGIDGDPQAYEEMRKPGSPFKATVAQDPDTMARIAVRMAFKLLNGEEVPRRHVYIPAKLVTIENLPEPGKRFPDEE
ncbi:hypothetical protein E3V08_03315 [Candidatus Atribacteria bacterium MT.SAG.1]|nr:hypothetical protein E3V08_03315 [Candidatus Atribacteria bacterium MT.SAG.1]